MSNVYVRDTTLTFKKGSWDIDEHSKVFRKMLDFLGQHGFYVCKDKEIVNKVVHFDCEDERKAKILLNRYIEAVREYNSTLPVENKDTDDIEIVIAE